jgi:Protein of unknown function (DUF2800)
MTDPLHSVFAFSASPRWIPCAGSMAHPQNVAEDTDGGYYANEGTAAHTIAANILKHNRTPAVGDVMTVGKDKITVTDEMLDHIATYIDDVQRRAIGGYLMVEQRVTLDGVEGFDKTNYGTSDVIIAMPAHDGRKAYGVVEDLKFGQGEKVYAWQFARPNAPFKMVMYLDSTDSAEVEPNYQLMMYALAALADIRLLVDEPDHILIVINQPRLGILSELRVPIAVLERFAVFAGDALKKAEMAMGLGVEACEKADAINPTNPHKFFTPGEKQCRWCNAPNCKARAAKVQAEVAADFDVIAANPPVVKTDAKAVAKAMLAVPFIMDWCNAVMVQANVMVSGGIEILGPDQKPYKFVEGQLGDRKWKKAAEAEMALLANLPPEQAYAPRKILSAAKAAKLLDRKKTKELWNDVFAPLIGRAPGKPILVQGSDPRPPYTAASTPDEFDVEEE